MNTGRGTIVLENDMSKIVGSIQNILRGLLAKLSTLYGEGAMTEVADK